MFPTRLIWSIKFRNQGVVDGNISKNRVMKLDEFLLHSNVPSRARQVYGNIKQTCAGASSSLCLTYAFHKCAHWCHSGLGLFRDFWLYPNNVCVSAMRICGRNNIIVLFLWNSSRFDISCQYWHISLSTTTYFISFVYTSSMFRPCVFNVMNFIAWEKSTRP